MPFVDTSHIVPMDHISRTSCEHFEGIWPTGVEQTLLLEPFMIMRAWVNISFAIATTQTKICYCRGSDWMFSMLYMSKCCCCEYYQHDQVGATESQDLTEGLRLNPPLST